MKNDVICLDFPLFTRLLEECREGIESDAELHFLLSTVIQQGNRKGDVLTMDDYADIMKFKEAFAVYKDQLEYLEDLDDDEEDPEDEDEEEEY